MPDRWTDLCRKLVPESLRERAFDPAAADLRQEWTARAAGGGRGLTPVARFRYGLRLVAIALECRRLAINTRWSPALPPEPRESRLSLWVRELRRTVRLLIRQPLFTAAAVVTLALGTGANLTIFSFVNSFLLAPIPVRDPSTLVRVYGTGDGNDRDTTSYPDYLDGRRRAPGVDLAAHAVTTTRVGTGAAVEARTAELVTGNYFRALALAPAAGVAIAYFSARVLESMMTGAGRFDPLVALSIALALGLLAVLAAWMPARRAAKADPVIALRM